MPAESSPEIRFIELNLNQSQEETGKWRRHITEDKSWGGRPEKAKTTWVGCMDGSGKGTRNQRESSWETVTVCVETAEMSREKMSVLKGIPYPSRGNPLPHTHLCFLWGDYLILQFLPFCCWYCPLPFLFNNQLIHLLYIN